MSLAPRVTGSTKAVVFWMILIAGLSVAGSFTFSCAAPLAAVAALAALTMGRTEGALLVIAAWLANQVVGFAFLGYPTTASTFAWGGAIGIAALAGFMAARYAMAARLPSVPGITMAFVLGFVAYQVVIFASGVVINGSHTVPAQLGSLFLVNAVAFVALLALERGAIAMSLLRPVSEPAAKAV